MHLSTLLVASCLVWTVDARGLCPPWSESTTTRAVYKMWSGHSVLFTSLVGGGADLSRTPHHMWTALSESIEHQLQFIPFMTGISLTDLNSPSRPVLDKVRYSLVQHITLGLEIKTAAVANAVVGSSTPLCRPEEPRYAKWLNNTRNMVDSMCELAFAPTNTEGVDLFYGSSWIWNAPVGARPALYDAAVDWVHTACLFVSHRTVSVGRVLAMHKAHMKMADMWIFLAHQRWLDQCIPNGSDDSEAIDRLDDDFLSFFS